MICPYCNLKEVPNEITKFRLQRKTCGDKLCIKKNQKAAQLKYYKNNKEKLKKYRAEYNKLYYEETPKETRKLIAKIYRENESLEAKLKRKERERKHRQTEKYKLRKKAYDKKRSKTEKFRKYQREYQRNKRRLFKELESLSQTSSLKI